MHETDAVLTRVCVCTLCVFSGCHHVEHISRCWAVVSVTMSPLAPSPAPQPRLPMIPCVLFSCHSFPTRAPPPFPFTTLRSALSQVQCIESMVVVEACVGMVGVLRCLALHACSLGLLGGPPYEWQHLFCNSDLQYLLPTHLWYLDTSNFPRLLPRQYEAPSSQRPRRR